MTRLRTEWITYMLDGMEEYNRQLRVKTGMDLSDLVMETFDIPSERYASLRQKLRVAVVPITQGEGIIDSFSQSVAAIVASMGFDADVMEHTDVDGIYDAVRTDRQILFFADDTRYLAVNVTTGKWSDNNYATALGFIRVMKALMERHGKDMQRETLLQIGFGIVGKEAAGILRQMGVDFDLYDKDSAAASAFDGKKLKGKEEIRQYSYILDFTNEGGWLTREDLAGSVLYASPGVPYSMDQEAAAAFEERAVHDNLEIGTAIMLGQCLLP